MRSVSALFRGRLALLAACAVALLAACSGGGGGPADTPVAPVATEPPPTPGIGDEPATPSNAATVGRARILSAAASVTVDDVVELATPSSPAPTPPGRSLHVDSQRGNDANDGLAATSSAGGSGPWRTLGRVARSDIGPGDVLRLACGSQWAETLRLPASGTAARPILVSTPAAGCTVRPAIEGSVVLPAAQWTRDAGNVYKTPLDSPPLQLTQALAGALPWLEAHHPNRGHSSTEPDSPYFRSGAASDVTSVAGHPGSTTIVTGADFQLPAGATLGPGTRARVRIYAWHMQELAVTGLTGNRIGLRSGTDYPLGADWGYLLLGQRWMVDSAREWHHDATARQLYAYMPDGAPPAVPLRATVLATGIDLRAQQHVLVEGVAVRSVGLGADLRDSTNVTLRNLRFEDIVDIGADVTVSTDASIEASTFLRIGGDGISGWRHNTGPSQRLTVRNSVVRDSGVLMDEDRLLSLPRPQYAAIYGGPRSTISGNTVVNAGYIGILAMPDSLVEKNFVYGACTVLDDCAGIYTQYGNNNIVIRGNTVLHARGALLGKPAAIRFTQAQGIYLDSNVTGALIEDNTVIDTDDGILIHVSARNTVRGNRLYANRRSQIWMQDTRNTQRPGGDVYDNVVTDNEIAPVSPTAVGIWLDTIYASTAGFGTIDRNHYFDRDAPIAVQESTATGTRTFTFDQWQRAAGAGLPGGRDATGSASSATGYASLSVAGNNLVPNGSLATNAEGWSSWNATPPAAQLLREACPAGFCLRLVPGGSQGVVSSGNFSIRKDQWYRVSVDLAAEQANSRVEIIVRRGGGGSNGFEELADRSFVVNAGRTWQRHSRVFRATDTVNVRDPVTGDLGARIDIMAVGTMASLANVELVPITADTAEQVSGALVNAGASAQLRNCPYVGAQAPLCSRLRRVGDTQVPSWPLQVPARSAVLLYAVQPALLDSDNDGIADTQDDCPATPAGSGVNARGCPLVPVQR